MSRLCTWIFIAILACANLAFADGNGASAGSSFLNVGADEQKAFFESFLVILISEIGDKTFLIAAILAMTNPRLTIFAAASSALLIMTVLSALLGSALPNMFRRDITQFLAAVLFIVFGAKMLKEGYDMDGSEVKQEMMEVEEELALRSSKRKSEPDLESGAILSMSKDTKPVTILDSVYNLSQFIFSPTFAQTFIMTFLAEWGDRSQISTIALAAAESMVFVSLGACLAHVLCTGAAVIGGRFLASKISVKTVTIVGAVMFLIFGFSTLLWCWHGAA